MCRSTSSLHHARWPPGIGAGAQSACRKKRYLCIQTQKTLCPRNRHRTCEKLPKDADASTKTHARGNTPRACISHYATSSLTIDGDSIAPQLQKAFRNTTSCYHRRGRPKEIHLTYRVNPLPPSLIANMPDRSIQNHQHPATGNEAIGNNTSTKADERCAHKKGTHKPGKSHPTGDGNCALPTGKTAEKQGPEQKACVDAVAAKSPKGKTDAVMSCARSRARVDGRAGAPSGR